MKDKLITRGIEVRQDEQQGQHVVAKRELARGSVILQESPYVSAVPPSEQPRQCRACFSPMTLSSKGRKACKQCGCAHYCSQVCLKRDLELHAVSGECALFKQLGGHCEGLPLLREAILAIRYLSKGPLSPPLLSHQRAIMHMLDDELGHSSVDALLDQLANARLQGKAAAKQLERAREAAKHANDSSKGQNSTQKDASSEEDDSDTDVAWKAWQDEGTVKVDPHQRDGDAEIEYMREKVASAFCMMIVNAIEVCQVPVGRVQNNQPPVPAGQLPLVLYRYFTNFNHSCRPNALYHFRANGQILLRTVADVVQGQQVNITYIDLLQPLSDRQQLLLDKYRFVCACERCQHEGATATSAGDTPDDDQAQELERLRTCLDKAEDLLMGQDDAESAFQQLLYAMQTQDQSTPLSPQYHHLLLNAATLLTSAAAICARQAAASASATAASAITATATATAATDAAAAKHAEAAAVATNLNHNTNNDAAVSITASAADDSCNSIATALQWWARAVCCGLVNALAADALLQQGEYGLTAQAGHLWADLGSLTCEALVAALSSSANQQPMPLAGNHSDAANKQEQDDAALRQPQEVPSSSSVTKQDTAPHVRHAVQQHVSSILRTTSSSNGQAAGTHEVLQADAKAEAREGSVHPTRQPEDAEGIAAPQDDSSMPPSKRPRLDLQPNGVAPASNAAIVNGSKGGHSCPSESYHDGHSFAQPDGAGHACNTAAKHSQASRACFQDKMATSVGLLHRQCTAVWQALTLTAGMQHTCLQSVIRNLLASSVTPAQMACAGSEAPTTAALLACGACHFLARGQQLLIQAYGEAHTSCEACQFLPFFVGLPYELAADVCQAANKLMSTIYKP